MKDKGGNNLLGAIRKLTEDIDDNIDPKFKEEAVKNISILHGRDLPIEWRQPFFGNMGSAQYNAQRGAQRSAGTIGILAQCVCDAKTLAKIAFSVKPC